MKRLLSLAITTSTSLCLFTAQPISVFAQQFRESGGCGMQCMYVQRKLSETQATRSGYRRVLVERKFSRDGGYSFTRVERIWLIADCQRGRVTWSFDSEGKDGWWHEAFFDGSPSSSSANLHAYDHLQALCS